MIKRIFTVLFSSILLFGFYSCGEKKETPKLSKEIFYARDLLLNIALLWGTVI